jgi:hypothetical protein
LRHTGTGLCRDVARIEAYREAKLDQWSSRQLHVYFDTQSGADVAL